MPYYRTRLAYFCNNFTSLTLNLTYNHHATVLLTSLQSLNSCSQVSHSCTPQLALLSITLRTFLKMPSCWFQTLELKMLLNSDSGHRGEFPNLQIYIFTLYFVRQVISKIADPELTLTGPYFRSCSSVTANHLQLLLENAISSNYVPT